MVENRTVISHSPVEFFAAQHIVQITEMMPEKRLPVLHQADRTFHLPAQRYHLRGPVKACRKGQGFWHTPARPAQDHPGGAAFHAVIKPPGNVAVMYQEPVSKPCKFLARFGIAHDLRFARQVSGCHDERSADGGDEHMVQRRIGQNQTQSVQSGGNGFRQEMP